MRYATALAITLVGSAAGGSLSAPPLAAGRLRLRGGEIDEMIAAQLEKQSKTGPLSREEIVDKLNDIPCFCIMQSDGSVISLPDPQGSEGDECCTWFTDASEAQATLRKVVVANPSLSGLKLASHGLGHYLTMSDSWPTAADAPAPSAGDAPRLKLQGMRGVADAVGPQLINALKGEGLDPGSWQLACFIAEELAQSTTGGQQVLLPVFLNPNDVRAAYAQRSIPAKALEEVRVMELRQLLKLMTEATPDAVNPWRAVKFFASPDAAKLAESLAA